MRGGCGQHEPDAAEPRRDGWREPLPLCHHHDGPGTVAQKGEFAGAGGADDAGRLRGLDHDRQRLARTRFAQAQSLYRRLVGRVAKQVKAARALQGDDTAIQQNGGDLRGAVAEAWSARRTGNGLGVEAPACGIGVLGPAGLAGREGSHAGVRPVIRHAVGHAEARAAIGAGGERIEVETAGRIEHVGEASSAGDGIRRRLRQADCARRTRSARRTRGARRTFTNGKARLACERQGGDLDGVNAGERWRRALQRGHACIDVRAFDLGEHALRIVQHEPGQRVARGQFSMLR